MSANISFNPMATTNAGGLFNVNSNGYTQGDAQDDPAIKFKLAGGVYAAANTTPIWGGMPMTEYVATVTSSSVPGTGVLGPQLLAATSGETDISCWCVVNQAFAGLTTPQSPAQTYGPGMSVNFYRNGSGARIPLRLNPAAVSAIEGGAVNVQFYWNWANNWITVTNTDYALPTSFKVLSISPSSNANKTVSYNGTTGVATYIYTDTVALCEV
jgi:hypothetical protein